MAGEFLYKWTLLWGFVSLLLNLILLILRVFLRRIEKSPFPRLRSVARDVLPTMSLKKILGPRFGITVVGYLLILGGAFFLKRATEQDLNSLPWSWGAVFLGALLQSIVGRSLLEKSKSE